MKPTFLRFVFTAVASMALLCAPSAFAQRGGGGHGGGGGGGGFHGGGGWLTVAVVAVASTVAVEEAVSTAAAGAVDITARLAAVVIAAVIAVAVTAGTEAAPTAAAVTVIRCRLRDVPIQPAGALQTLTVRQIVPAIPTMRRATAEARLLQRATAARPCRTSDAAAALIQQAGRPAVARIPIRTPGAVVQFPRPAPMARVVRQTHLRAAPTPRADRRQRPRPVLAALRPIL